MKKFRILALSLFLSLSALALPPQEDFATESPYGTYQLTEGELFSSKPHELLYYITNWNEHLTLQKRTFNFQASKTYDLRIPPEPFPPHPFKRELYLKKVLSKYQEKLHHAESVLKDKISSSFFNTAATPQRLTHEVSKTQLQETVKGFSKNIRNALHLDEDVFVFKDLWRGDNESFQFFTCLYPSLPQDLSPIRKLFLSSKYNQMTCPQPINNIKILSEKRDSFLSKIEILMGKKLSPDILQDLLRQRNLILDFSKAPEIKKILISALVFRNDLTGSLALKVLEHHAKQNTEIKIYLSNSISYDKEKEVLNSFDEKYENVQVRFYKYNNIYKSSKSSFKHWFSQFHRSLHTKTMLVEYEDKEKEPVIVAGGRNFHDGFVFELHEIEQKQKSEEEKTQYGETCSWDDMDFTVQDRAFFESMEAQYQALWQKHDSHLLFLKNTHLHVPTKAPLDSGYFDEENHYIRHFLSSPYQEVRVLESLFVELIESAQKSIKIVSPYLHFTERFKEALLEAHSKGLKVELITRLILAGDTADTIITKLNKETMNEFFKKIDIYDFVKKDSILHSKIILIDDEFTTIGAVNLNKRAFLIDIENTSLIWSPHYYQKFNEIFESYKALSHKVKDKQDVTHIEKVFISPIIWMFPEAF